MENENFIEKLASKLGQNAFIKNVFGEPVHAGNKTIIPVAQIGYGFGGGYEKQDEELPHTNDSTGKKYGGGGGLLARPKGVYEITPDATRFIPANNLKRLLTCFAAGFLISKIFFLKYNKIKK